MQALADRKKKVGTSQKGISLFIVISALLILAVHTISITAQLMAPVFVATSATQQIVRENELRSALQILKPIIRLASTAGAASQPDIPKLDGTPFPLEINAQTRTFTLQDVNGLIDINSASRGLLPAFLEQIGSSNHIVSILEQRAAKPFSSVEEFSQHLNIATTANLSRLLTVSSGRRRINSHTAPIELLQILAGQNGFRAQLAAQLDRRFLRVRPITDVLVFRN